MPGGSHNGASGQAIGHKKRGPVKGLLVNNFDDVEEIRRFLAMGKSVFVSFAYAFREIVKTGEAFS